MGYDCEKAFDGDRAREMIKKDMALSREKLLELAWGYRLEVNK